jgi:Pyruvate/2-oxoacid:ferredoxin oxidoreductase gamma subunit
MLDGKYFMAKNVHWQRKRTAISSFHVTASQGGQQHLLA